MFIAGPFPDIAHPCIDAIDTAEGCILGCYLLQPFQCDVPTIKVKAVTGKGVGRKGDVFSELYGFEVLGVRLVLLLLVMVGPGFLIR